MDKINFVLLSIILTILCIHHESKEKLNDIYITEENVKCPEFIKKYNGHYKCDKHYKVRREK